MSFRTPFWIITGQKTNGDAMQIGIADAEPLAWEMVATWIEWVEAEQNKPHREIGAENYTSLTEYARDDLGWTISINPHEPNVLQPQHHFCHEVQK